jgi:hypothetical protein
MKFILLMLFILFSALFGLCSGQKKFLSGNPHAYSLPEEEDKLLAIYTKWIACTTTHFCQDAERLDFEFLSMFQLILNNRKTSFEYPFPNLVANKAIRMFTSGDGKLKLYNFNKFSFRSEQKCYTFFQWKNDQEPVTLMAEGDEKIAALYTVDIAGETYYLLFKNTIKSSEEVLQSISCLTFQDGQLIQDVAIFQNQGRLEKDIRIAFRRTSIDNPLDEVDAFEQDLNRMKYDPENQEIFIPVIQNGRMHTIFIN